MAVVWGVVLARAPLPPYAVTVLAALAQEKLENLRDQLKELGDRPSMRFPTASPALLDAVTMVERYGAVCEAMYLVMVADGKVLNVEREVLRGALAVVSEGRVRTAHMEAMLDGAAKALVNSSASARIDVVANRLRSDPVKVELVCVLCVAVALADGVVSEEEHSVIDALVAALGVDSDAANQLLSDMSQD